MKFDVANIERELDEFAVSIEAVDMENVKEESLKRIADEMYEQVRLAIRQSDITSPAFNGPYQRGDGSSLITRNAWDISKQSSGRYTIRPRPEVRQRAIVLNYGYPGRIEPNQADALKFTVNGEPVWADSVEGPDSTGYWNMAFKNLTSSGRVDEILEDELRKEFEKHFN